MADGEVQIEAVEVAFGLGTSSSTLNAYSMVPIGGFNEDYVLEFKIG